MRKLGIALAVASAFISTACLDGGSSSSSSSASTGSTSSGTISGSLLDAAVEGVAYTVSDGRSGNTDSKGTFTCTPGSTVTFTLGGITLGSVSCVSLVTPLELAGTTDLNDTKVKNRLLFLQILDEDDNPDNGIKITPAVFNSMAGKNLNFATADNAAIAALLPALADKFGVAYSSRTVNADRLAVAREHFESTMATQLSRSETSESTQASAGGAVKITKYTLQADNSLFIPYQGTNAAMKNDFPLGFYPAVGSGLAYKGKGADGSLEFLAITDRGPNGDGPDKGPNGTWTDGTTTYGGSKIFPAPHFNPSIGLVSVGKSGAVLKSLTPISVDAATKVSGRPLAAGATGSSGEAPLSDDLKFDTSKIGFDSNGLDTESVVIDSGRNAIWVSDEYGPFIVKLDPANYRIQAKFGPGNGLPAVLAKRRANRGMEGLSLNPASKTLHGFLQSPIDDGSVTVGTTKKNVKDYASFLRWLEFDPDTLAAKLYAYPLAAADYKDGKTGNAKLGDLTALGNGKFLVIEQGAGPDGSIFNWLMLVEIPSGATDIANLNSDLEKSSVSGAAVNTANYASVVTLKKTRLLDLNAADWRAEKAEGLTVVDEYTVAIINDNDFGLRTIVLDGAGKEVSGGDITKCAADASGQLSGCGNGVGGRVTRGQDKERPTRLWLFRFPNKLTTYSVSGS